MTIVNLYPDNPRQPRAWRSEDAADPEIVLLLRPGGTWAAKLERRIVGHADTAEHLTAQLYGEYDLVAVLHESAAAEA